MGNCSRRPRRTGTRGTLAARLVQISIGFAVLLAVLFQFTVPLVAPIVGAGLTPPERAQLSAMAWYLVPWVLCVIPFYALSAIHKAQRVDFDGGKKAAELSDAVNLCRKMHRHLIRGELSEFGRDLHAAWQLKRGFTSSVSNGRVDDIYSAAMSAGRP